MQSMKQLCPMKHACAHGGNDARGRDETWHEHGRRLDRDLMALCTARVWWLLQIAADGSQKIPQRLLSSISDCIHRGRLHPRLSLAVASWMVSIRGRSEDGVMFEIQDPLANQLLEIYSDTSGEPSGLFEAICTRTGIIPLELATNSNFKGSIVSSLSLLQQGVLQCIQSEHIYKRN